MSRNKKPTMNEMKDVVSNLIQHVAFIEKKVQQVNTVLGGYIEYKKDSNIFPQWLNKKIEKEMKKDGGTAKSSNKGNKETK